MAGPAGVRGSGVPGTGEVAKASPQVGWDRMGRVWTVVSGAVSATLERVPFVKACVECVEGSTTGAWRWSVEKTGKAVAVVQGVKELVTVGLQVSDFYQANKVKIEKARVAALAFYASHRDEIEAAQKTAGDWYEYCQAHPELLVGVKEGAQGLYQLYEQYKGDIAKAKEYVAAHLDDVRSGGKKAVELYQTYQPYLQKAKEYLDLVLAAASGPEEAVKLINEALKDLTSEERETFLAEWTGRVYSKVVHMDLGAVPQEETLRAALPPAGVQSAKLTAQYALNLLDDRCVQQCPALSADDYVIVLDLGRSGEVPTPSTTVEGVLGQVAYVRTKADIRAEVGDDHDSRYVYLYQVTVGKFGVWVRRERQKVQEELNRACLMAYGNLLSTLKEREHDTHGAFAQDVLGEVMQVLAQHFQLFAQWVDLKGLALERLDSQQHWAMRDKEVVRRQLSEEHARELATLLKTMAFPTGEKDLPIPAHYRRLIDGVVLPAVLTQVMQKSLEAVATPEVMNTLLLNIVKSIPKPRELTPGETPQKTTEVPVGLRRDAGNFMVTLLRIASVDFCLLYDDIGKQIESLVPGINVRRSIDDALGDMLGHVLVDWMQSTIGNAEQMFDWSMTLLNTGFLEPSLHPQSRREARKRAEKTQEELNTQLQELLSNFYPYIRTTVLNAAMGKGKAVAKEVSAQLDRLPDEGKVGKAVWKGMGKAAGAVGEGVVEAVKHGESALEAFTGIDDFQRYIDQKCGAKEVRDFLSRMYSEKHASLWHRLFDVVLYSIADKEKPTRLRNF